MALRFNNSNQLQHLVQPKQMKKVGDEQKGNNPEEQTPEKKELIEKDANLDRVISANALEIQANINRALMNSQTMLWKRVDGQLRSVSSGSTGGSSSVQADSTSSVSGAGGAGGAGGSGGSGEVTPQPGTIVGGVSEKVLTEQRNIENGFKQGKLSVTDAKMKLSALGVLHTWNVKADSNGITVDYMVGNSGGQLTCSRDKYKFNDVKYEVQADSTSSVSGAGSAGGASGAEELVPTSVQGTIVGGVSEKVLTEQRNIENDFKQGKLSVIDAKMKLSALGVLHTWNVKVDSNGITVDYMVGNSGGQLTCSRDKYKFNDVKYEVQADSTSSVSGAGGAGGAGGAKFSANDVKQFADKFGQEAVQKFLVKEGNEYKLNESAIKAEFGEEANNVKTLDDLAEIINSHDIEAQELRSETFLHDTLEPYKDMLYGMSDVDIEAVYSSLEKTAKDAIENYLSKPIGQRGRLGLKKILDAKFAELTAKNVDSKEGTTSSVSYTEAMAEFKADAKSYKLLFAILGNNDKAKEIQNAATKEDYDALKTHLEKLMNSSDVTEEVKNRIQEYIYYVGLISNLDSSTEDISSFVKCSYQDANIFGTNGNDIEAFMLSYYGVDTNTESNVLDENDLKVLIKDILSEINKPNRNSDHISANAYKLLIYADAMHLSQNFVDMLKEIAETGTVSENQAIKLNSSVNYYDDYNNYCNKAENCIWDVVDNVGIAEDIPFEDVAKMREMLVDLAKIYADKMGLNRSIEEILGSSNFVGIITFALASENYEQFLSEFTSFINTTPKENLEYDFVGSMVSYIKNSSSSAEILDPYLEYQIETREFVINQVTVNKLLQDDEFMYEFQNELLSALQNNPQSSILNIDAFVQAAKKVFAGSDYNLDVQTSFVQNYYYAFLSSIAEAYGVDLVNHDSNYYLNLPNDNPEKIKFRELVNAEYGDILPLLENSGTSEARRAYGARRAPKEESLWTKIKRGAASCCEFMADTSFKVGTATGVFSDTMYVGMLVTEGVSAAAAVPSDGVSIVADINGTCWKFLGDAINPDVSWRDTFANLAGNTGSIVVTLIPGMDLVNTTVNASDGWADKNGDYIAYMISNSLKDDTNTTNANGEENHPDNNPNGGSHNVPKYYQDENGNWHKNPDYNTKGNNLNWDTRASMNADGTITYQGMTFTQDEFLVFAQMTGTQIGIYAAPGAAFEQALKMQGSLTGIGNVNVFGTFQGCKLGEDGLFHKRTEREDGTASEIIIDKNNGTKTIIEYDKDGNEIDRTTVKTIIDEENGTKTIIEYDKDGNVVGSRVLSEQRNSDGSTTITARDEDGKILNTQTRYPDGTTETVHYDSNGAATFMYTKNSDGSYKETRLNSDGSQEITYHDNQGNLIGTVKMGADGSIIKTYPNGTVDIYDAEGGFTRRYSDGSEIKFDKNGNVISDTRSTEGSSGVGGGSGSGSIPKQSNAFILLCNKLGYSEYERNEMFEKYGNNDQVALGIHYALEGGMSFSEALDVCSQLGGTSMIFYRELLQKGFIPEVYNGKFVGVEMSSSKEADMIAAFEQMYGNNREFGDNRDVDAMRAYEDWLWQQANYYGDGWSDDGTGGGLFNDSSFWDDWYSKQQMQNELNQSLNDMQGQQSSTEELQRAHNTQYTERVRSREEQLVYDLNLFTNLLSNCLGPSKCDNLDVELFSSYYNRWEHMGKPTDQYDFNQLIRSSNMW